MGEIIDLLIFVVVMTVIWGAVGTVVFALAGINLWDDRTHWPKQ